MSINLNNIIDNIKNEKEIISTLPVNTKKNRAAYVEKLSQIKEEYENIKKEVYSKIVEEYETEMSQIGTIDDKLESRKKDIKEIEEIENIINHVKTPFEKMRLDKHIYYLKRFYKNNLETVNEEIRICIDLFEQVGIKLEASDFDFTKYTYQYMSKFFIELKKGKIDDKAMKQEFEKIYWESPDIIIHIRLNFVYLYLKNENVITEFYDYKEKEAKKSFNVDYEELKDKYNYLKRKQIETEKSQGKVIIENFLQGHWNIKDYEEKALNKSYLRFVNLEKLKENREEIDNNLIKLLHNLYEYNNYLKFKYLFEEVKEIFKSEKGKYTYKDLKKKIIKKCKTLHNVFGISQKRNLNILKEIEVLCEELDIIRIKEKIGENLNEKSNLKEMSNVIASFYKHLFIWIIKYNPDIIPEDIIINIEQFEEFVKYPYNTISESIMMFEEKDIPLMIKDRYSLFDIKITRESLEEDNIQNLITELQKIENNYYIRQAGLNIADIERLCEMKKVIYENYQS